MTETHWNLFWKRFFHKIVHFFQNINSFSLNLITYICEIGFFSMWNFMLSYFITTSMINAMLIGDAIYDLHWYQLSHSEQFIVQMLVQRSQTPFQLKGLGIFNCSLETYLKVIQAICSITKCSFMNQNFFVFQMVKTALSYYMIFRRL